jgi:hypothetical protein
MTDASHKTDSIKTTSPTSVGPQPATSAPDSAQPLALRLQRAIGNTAALRLGSGLRMGAPGDAQEQVADRAGERIAQAIPSATPAALGGPGDRGAPITRTVRSAAEHTLGSTLGDVRLHDGSAAARSAESLHARAYTLGRDIVFNHGQLTTSSIEGRRLLGHELAHVAQQAVSGRMVQRQPKPDSATAPQTPPADKPPDPGIPLIPPEAVREPSRDDVLVALSADNRMVVLPARGAMVVLQPAPAGRAPATPLFTLPTIGKEVLMMVNVGRNTGFALDVGGRTVVVFPHAMNAIQSALGVTKVTGGMITHVHEDHVRSLEQMVTTRGIRPENLHIPAAYLASPAVRAGMLGEFLGRLEKNPNLRSQGFRQGAAYSVIPTATQAAFFRNVVREGNTEFEYVGLTRPFQELSTARTNKELQKSADPGSLLVRVTHVPSGTRTLYVSDIRGNTLNQIRDAMTADQYREFLSGVTTIVNFQHHLGALDSPADRAGLVELLMNTYLRTGSLRVMAQSYETGPKGQFLNRSLIEGLRQLGVDVDVALEPGARGQMGTLTAWTGGTVSQKGGGQMVSFLGEGEVQAQVRRLLLMREAEEILTKYEQFLTQPGRQSAAMRAARETHERNLRELFESTMTNVQTGASGRAQASLANPAAQQAARARIFTAQPVEWIIMPAEMANLRELGRIGPHLETLEREFKAARSSGRLSTAGIDALWEINPQLAERLVRSSGMSRGAQRQAMQSMPGAPPPMRSRIAGGVLLFITIFNEVAPYIQQVQARQNDENVGRQLNDIMWWQSKGVFPKLEAVNDKWGWWRNAWANDQPTIQKWIEAGDLDFLAMTDIPDDAWDFFTIWATTTIQTLKDWQSFIGDSIQKGRLRETISGANSKWAWRRTRVKSTWYGYDVDADWVESDRLATILNAAYWHMHDVTEQGIAQVGKTVGPADVTKISKAGTYLQQETYLGKPQAIGKRRFKASVSEPELYTVAHQRSREVRKDSVFWLFDPKAVPLYKVPSGYVVVGGADFLTYNQIFYTVNRVETGGVWYDLFPNTLEVLFAKEADLESAP